MTESGRAGLAGSGGEARLAAPGAAEASPGQHGGPQPGRPAGAIGVRVRFFALYREWAGADEAALEVPAGSSVADLVSLLRDSPRLERLPPDPAVAVNLIYAPSDQRLRDGDEVALIPPVAGG